MNLTSPFFWLIVFLAPALSLAQTRPVTGTPQDTTGTTVFPQDTAGIDSSRPPVSNIVRIFPKNLWQQERTALEDTVRTGIRTLHVWDLTDTLEGYVQSLGQIGKPVGQWIHGASASVMQESGWRNPFFNRKDPFVLSPSEDIPHYDTKTPYVNISYMQGPKRLQAVSVTASANVTPNLNITAGHIRRKSTGVYGVNRTDNTTDHRNAYTSLYYRSPNRRYHGFATGVYNQLEDDLFGGEIRIEGSTDNNSFRKLSSRRVLSTSVGDRIVQSAHTSHAYCLIGRPYDDTTQHRQRLTLMADGGVEAMRWRYRARDIPADLAIYESPVLPALDDTVRISWGIITTEQYASAGAGYVLSTGIFQLKATARAGYRQLRLIQDDGASRSTPLAQRTAWQQATGQLEIPRLRTQLSLDWYQATSSLLPYTNRLQAAGSTGIGSRLRVQAQAKFLNTNPSLFQRYALAPQGTTWTANSSLRNQQTTHLWAALRWAGKTQRLDSLTDVSQFVQAGAFLTRTDNFIGYTRNLEVRQARSSENLQWAGLEFSGRKRFGKTWFTEARLTVQQGLTGVNDTLWLAAYARNLPNVWGKASFYYDNRDLSIAGILRVGIDLYAFTAHSPLAFDVMSGEFFPADYRIKGYVRADAFFAAQVSKTYIFFKITHLNEGFGQPGYYTTPTWPMLERTISFGVNWSFFD